MTTTIATQTIAEQARKYMVEQYGSDLAEMCREASVAIVEAFGGEIWAGNYESDPDQYHYVAVIDGVLIDVTADQFGGPEIVCGLYEDVEFDGYLSMVPVRIDVAPASRPDLAAAILSY